MIYSRISNLAILATLFCGVGVFSLGAHAQNTDAAAPPALGSQTKGTPAVVEAPSKKSVVQAPSEDATSPSSAITEYRYESGQVYRIELDNTIGGKQYIEETNSDGQLLGDKNTDIEDTPNLPKWKLGSW